MISTVPSPSFVFRSVLMAVLFIGFGLWGAYDLWVTIPARAERAQRFEELTTRLATLEVTRAAQTSSGRPPAAELVAEYQQIETELTALAPGGKVPARPSKFDHVVQWIYISCLPFGVWPIITLARVARQRYRLDDDGSLHYAGDAEHGAGSLAQNQIADIDMSRWMAKSIAWVVGVDNRRIKLDAYVHKNLDLIIGNVAHRLHPDAWLEDARPVKKTAESEGGAPAPAEGS